MATTPSLFTPKTSFQDGVDSMWRFQLRKENAVLLENQEAQDKILQALTAEFTKVKKDFEERCLALETRISNLEHGERKDRHTLETWREEMSSLKSQMGLMTEKQEEEIAEAQAAAPVIDRPLSRMLNAYSTNLPISSYPATAASTTPPTNQSISMTPLKANADRLMLAPVTNVTLHTTTNNAHRSPDLAGPMTRSRSRSRSTSLPHISAPLHPAQDQTPPPVSRPKVKASYVATPTGKTVNIPRLHQGTSSLESYLDKATTTWLSLPEPKDQKLEIQFIALFIKGMRDADKREILVGELQQQHQSRTKKDGKVEILCKWRDVGQGMRDAELITVADFNTGQEIARKDKKSGYRLLKELQTTDGFHQN